MKRRLPSGRPGSGAPLDPRQASCWLHGATSGRFSLSMPGCACSRAHPAVLSECHLRTRLRTIRRECLDWLIPLSGAHLRQTLKLCVAHCNRGRPHTALGPGVPRSSREFDRDVVALSVSSRRLSLGSCQSNTRRVAPRVFVGACVTKRDQPRFGRTRLLRSTGVAGGAEVIAPRPYADWVVEFSQ